MNSQSVEKTNVDICSVYNVMWYKQHTLEILVGDKSLVHQQGS